MYTLIAAILINSSTPYQQDIHEEYSSREQCESRANFIIKNDEYTGNEVLFTSCSLTETPDFSQDTRPRKNTWYPKFNRVTIMAFKSRFVDTDFEGKFEMRLTGKKIVLRLHYTF